MKDWVGVWWVYTRVGGWLVKSDNKACIWLLNSISYIYESSWASYELHIWMFWDKNSRSDSSLLDGPGPAKQIACSLNLLYFIKITLLCLMLLLKSGSTTLCEGEASKLEYENIWKQEQAGTELGQAQLQLELGFNLIKVCYLTLMITNYHYISWAE